MITAAAGEYLRWTKDVDQHDQALASGYLSLRFGARRLVTDRG